MYNTQISILYRTTTQFTSLFDTSSASSFSSSPSDTTSPRVLRRFWLRLAITPIYSCTLGRARYQKRRLHVTITLYFDAFSSKSPNTIRRSSSSLWTAILCSSFSLNSTSPYVTNMFSCNTPDKEEASLEWSKRGCPPYSQFAEQT
jgi:hypothetical protein